MPHFPTRLFNTSLSKVIMTSSPVNMSEFSIPRTCKAGVMHNEGPDFYVKVEEVEVPSPGKLCLLVLNNISLSDIQSSRTR